MICRSGRHRSFANAELWSNTLTRRSRRQHSVSLSHLCELDVWETTRVQETVRNAANSLSEFFKHTTTKSKLSVYDVFLCPIQWQADESSHDWSMRKVLRDQPRTLWMVEDHLPQTSKTQATSATDIPTEANPSRGILDELAERLGSLHESDRALASYLQDHDVSRKIRPEYDRGSQVPASEIAGRGE